MTDAVKDFVIQNYCREPGVRSLKKLLNKITEKTAYELVDNEHEGPGYHVQIDVDTIEKFIGHPLYRSSKFYSLMPPPGVVIGLAYNEYGGSILYIESTQSSFEEKMGKGELKITG